MGIIMLNGIQYGGGAGGGDFAGAAFIDTDNVIVPVTALPSSVVEYTATEDCYLYVQLGGQSQINYVNIDGKQIFYSNPTSWMQESGLIPLAKGQTAEIHGRQTNDSYAVYGVKYSGGSSGGSGISYSTDEQDTGLKWIDGSKIYQITKVYENVAQTSDSNPLTLDTLSDVDILVKYDVRATTTGGGVINDNFYLDNSYKFHTIYYSDTKELQYRANWGGSGYFTITITYQYTKEVN